MVGLKSIFFIIFVSAVQNERTAYTKSASKLSQESMPYSMVLPAIAVTSATSPPPLLALNMLSNSLPIFPSIHTESKKVSEFTIKKLMETSSVKSIDWSPFLISILSWTSKFPPLSQQNSEDRRLLLQNSWHSLFLFYYSTQFSSALDLKKSILPSKNDNLKEMQKVIETLELLKLNPIEQWTFACILIFRPG